VSLERPIRLLVNPHAGGGRVAKLLPEVESALRKRELEYELVQTTGIEHGCEQASVAAAEGAVPVVMSGDGLIGQVGGALAGTGVPMGIIPGGRGNDLARVLGVPREVDLAVDVLAAGNTRSIDVGEVNGHRFLCIASFGFDSEANRIANKAKLVRGQLVYAYAALRALAAWKPARFTLSLDGERHEFSGYSVAIANSRAFGGGMFVAPDAELDDGLLDVVWITQIGKLRYLRGLPKVFDGTHVNEPQVNIARAAEVEVSADRPFEIYTDGDHVVDLPARVRVIPDKLEVLAPPGPLASPSGQR
jgi:YegS/Rv2252/BmrU family lipid kinase